MPKLPRTARQDVSHEDAALDALLAGNEPPGEAGAELRPVADVLAALAARPAGGELTGLAAAQAEFRRHVAVSAQARRSRRRRPAGLVSRLGLRLSAATAVVIMGLGGAAAVGYAGALPSSWQQFAHATIGAPERGTGHGARAATSSARPSPRPDSLHPTHQPHSEGAPARHASRHHIRPRRTRPPAVWPFLHRGWPSPSPAAGRWPLPSPQPASTDPVPTPEPTEPVATPDAGPSNT
jgi:hypothetical protein